MDNVSMMLGYKHVIFYYFPVLIIAIVCPVIPSTCSISDFEQSFFHETVGLASKEVGGRSEMEKEKCCSSHQLY